MCVSSCTLGTSVPLRLLLAVAQIKGWRKHGREEAGLFSEFLNGKKVRGISLCLCSQYVDQCSMTTPLLARYLNFSKSFLFYCCFVFFCHWILSFFPAVSNSPEEEDFFVVVVKPKEDEIT